MEPLIRFTTSTTCCACRWRNGPSELTGSGKLVNWDRTADLGTNTVPTLVVGARYDTMDPKHMEMMNRLAELFPSSRFVGMDLSRTPLPSRGTRRQGLTNSLTTSRTTGMS
jgi:hypothetical protein